VRCAASVGRIGYSKYPNAGYFPMHAIGTRRNIMRHFLCKTALVACTVSLSACASWGELPPVSLLGQQVEDSAATQSVLIGPDTRWANIESGQIVRFVIGSRTFTWAFNNSQEVTSFDLNRVTPPGLLDHRVTIYLTPDPKYTRR
jgi:hypothetical protein